LVFREADETIAYSWFTYIPSNLRKEQLNYILINGLHGNIQTDNYEEVVAESRTQAEWRTSLADQLRAIMLVPVIPTSPGYFYYPVAFGMRTFGDPTPSSYQRADLKVNLMIDRLISDLRSEGYNMSEKVFIEGFSAGGMFAQKYTLLHPERVQAIAAGHCGSSLTLPESFYGSVPLNWPVGINDLPQLVGHQFNIEAYMRVPQYIYIGEQDRGTLSDGVEEWWGSQSQIDFVEGTFGDYASEILERQTAYLNSIGYDNIEFKKYSGVPHQYTDQMIDDALAFLDAHR
jgi:pimeloyl-ACP methyl ester carboxylesterase